MEAAQLTSAVLSPSRSHMPERAMVSALVENETHLYNSC